MKMKQIIAAVLGVAMAGCATRQGVVDVAEENDVCGMMSYMHLEAKHVHLKSILGIDDAVLADTNRFVLGSGSYSHEFTIDKPFGGFSKVRVYLDRMVVDPLGSDAGGKPHRLRSVDLKRWLPDATTEKELLAEWQASCDLVANILDLEPPKVRLVDVGKLRRCRTGRIETMLHGVQSSMTFRLAGNQYITVRLAEPTYAMRDGKAVMVVPGSVSIDLMYNLSLCGRFAREVSGQEEKIEKEVDFGPDCRDKLAAALKDGIERRARRVKRKPAKDNVNKAK